jgi:hypothetical protein
MLNPDAFHPDAEASCNRINAERTSTWLSPQPADELQEVLTIIYAMYLEHGPAGNLNHYYEGRKQRESSSGEVTVHVCACGFLSTEREECFDHVAQQAAIERLKAEGFTATAKALEGL